MSETVSLDIITSYIAGEDLAPNRLIKLSGGQAVYADAGDVPIAVTASGVAQGQAVQCISLIGAKYTVVGAKAITAGSDLYTADSGRVSDVANGSVIGSLNGTINAAGGKAQAHVWGACGAGSTGIGMTGRQHYQEDFDGFFVVTGGKCSETADQAEWLKSSVDTDADGADVCKTVDDGPGGILELTVNDNDADREQIQKNGEAFKLATGKPLEFETRIAIKDIDKCHVFVGLAISDTTILDGVTDRVGFEIDADGNIDALIEQDSTEYKSDTAVDIADCAAVANFADQSVRLKFAWDGAGVVRFYVNGTLTSTFTDNGTTILVPDDEAMSPALAIRPAAGAAATQTVWNDYIEIDAERWSA